MFENDDINFYQEQNHPKDPSTSSYKNRYNEYKTTKKAIKVKDANTILFEVKSSIHGPLMNNFIQAIDSKHPISMSWMYGKMPNQLLAAIYEMSHAKNKEDFQQGFKNLG